MLHVKPRSSASLIREPCFPLLLLSLIRDCLSVVSVFRVKNDIMWFLPRQTKPDASGSSGGQAPFVKPWATTPDA